MVALWLEHGAELEGSGAIVAAAGAGKISMLKYLLEKVTNVNEVNTRQQSTSCGSMKIGGALHQAAPSQCEEIVALLIEKGEDVRLKDAGDKTLSFYVYEKGNGNILKMLLGKKRTWAPERE